MAYVREVVPGLWRVECKRTINGQQYRWSWYVHSNEKKDADQVAGNAEADLDKGIDPDIRHMEVARSRQGTTVAQWSAIWLPAQDMEEPTRSKTLRILELTFCPSSAIRSSTTRPRPGSRSKAG
jgi:hypothetical protein